MAFTTPVHGAQLPTSLTDIYVEESECSKENK